jgi:hypothetical protein
MIECLPNKSEVLSSNSSTAKTRKKKKERKWPWRKWICLHAEVEDSDLGHFKTSHQRLGCGSVGSACLACVRPWVQHQHLNRKGTEA